VFFFFLTFEYGSRGDGVAMGGVGGCARERVTFLCLIFPRTRLLVLFLSFFLFILGAGVLLDYLLSRDSIRFMYSSVFSFLFFPYVFRCTFMGGISLSDCFLSFPFSHKYNGTIAHISSLTFFLFRFLSLPSATSFFSPDLSSPSARLHSYSAVLGEGRREGRRSE
jgi:hypothetical protein